MTIGLGAAALISVTIGVLREEADRLHSDQGALELALMAARVGTDSALVRVAKVFDVIQPIAQELAQHGRTPGGRRAILKHIGNALLVQHRVSGLVAVAEKPDVLWERPVLERFYARLEDEYELKERADVLTRKLTVISDSAKAFADIIDTERSLRLELIIVVLIVVEIVIAGIQLLLR